jgi:hypothetical protein
MSRTTTRRARTWLAVASLSAPAAALFVAGAAHAAGPPSPPSFCLENPAGSGVFTCTYTTSEQTFDFTPPAGATDISVTAYGGSGGNISGTVLGGAGACVQTSTPVVLAAGDTIRVFPGGTGNGTNGGTNGDTGGAGGAAAANGAGGGASTNVYTVHSNVLTLLLAAGGGGGASGTAAGLNADAPPPSGALSDGTAGTNGGGGGGGGTAGGAGAAAANTGGAGGDSTGTTCGLNAPSSPGRVLVTYTLGSALPECVDPALGVSEGYQLHYVTPHHRYVGGSNRELIIGTDGRDRIYGGGKDDIICGMGGNDFISGGSGDDRIDGGDGRDVIQGGSGNDTIVGTSNGPDRVLTSSGNDVMTP